jgi:hypothetical protein
MKSSYILICLNKEEWIDVIPIVKLNSDIVDENAFELSIENN